MRNDQEGSKKNGKPLWIKKGKRHRDKYCRYEKLLSDSYKKHEIIVFFDKAPSTKDIETVKKSFIEYGFDPKTIGVRRCDNCNIPIVLFQAENIHTVISDDGVRAGSGPPTSIVGEKYSLNFFNRAPFDKREGQVLYKSQPCDRDQKKEKIVVAVLDTGVDKQLIDPNCLWNGSR